MHNKAELNDTTSAFQPHRLAAALWQRILDLQITLEQAKAAESDEGQATILAAIQAAALLLCAIPARTMDELGPKVMASNLVAEEDGILPSYARRMCELAITADMRALQGPSLVEELMRDEG